MKGKEMQRYVPRGRRELLDKQKTENTTQERGKVLQTRTVSEILRSTESIKADVPQDMEIEEHIIPLPVEEASKRQKTGSGRPVGQYVPPHLRHLMEKGTNSEANTKITNPSSLLMATPIVYEAPIVSRSHITVSTFTPDLEQQKPSQHPALETEEVTPTEQMEADCTEKTAPEEYIQQESSKPADTGTAAGNARPMGRYLPPHLRNQLPIEDTALPASDLPSSSRPIRHDPPSSSSSSAYLPCYQPPTILDDRAFRDEIDFDKLSNHCLIFTTNHLQDYRRELVTQAYLASCSLTHGVAVQWINPSLCLIVYLNEHLLQRSMEKLQQQQSSVLISTQPRVLKEAAGDYCQDKEVIQVAKDLYRTLQPQRDNRVANRLIGAALGIRLAPSKKKDGSSSGSSSSRRPPRQSDANVSNEMEEEEGSDSNKKQKVSKPAVAGRKLVDLVEWDDDDSEMEEEEEEEESERVANQDAMQEDEDAIIDGSGDNGRGDEAETAGEG